MASRRNLISSRLTKLKKSGVRPIHFEYFKRICNLDFCKIGQRLHTPLLRSVSYVISEKLKFAADRKDIMSFHEEQTHENANYNFPLCRRILLHVCRKGLEANDERSRKITHLLICGAMELYMTEAGDCCGEIMHWSGLKSEHHEAISERRVHVESRIKCSWIRATQKPKRFTICPHNTLTKPNP